MVAKQNTFCGKQFVFLVLADLPNNHHFNQPSIFNKYELLRQKIQAGTLSWRRHHSFHQVPWKGSHSYKNYLLPKLGRDSKLPKIPNSVCVCVWQKGQICIHFLKAMIKGLLIFLATIGGERQDHHIKYLLCESVLQFFFPTDFEFWMDRCCHRGTSTDWWSGQSSWTRMKRWILILYYLWWWSSE